MNPEAPLLAAKRRYTEAIAALEKAGPRPTSDEHLRLYAWDTLHQQMEKQWRASQAQWQALRVKASAGLRELAIRRSLARREPCPEHTRLAHAAEQVLLALVGPPKTGESLAQTVIDAIQPPEPLQPATKARKV